MVQDIYNILNEKKQINPSPEDIEISNKNFQQDPDLPENFEGYLGYTDRQSC